MFKRIALTLVAAVMTLWLLTRLLLWLVLTVGGLFAIYLATRQPLGAKAPFMDDAWQYAAQRRRRQRQLVVGLVLLFTGWVCAFLPFWVGVSMASLVAFGLWRYWVSALYKINFGPITTPDFSDKPARYGKFDPSLKQVILENSLTNAPEDPRIAAPATSLRDALTNTVDPMDAHVVRTTCPRCKRVSYHPRDIQERYCSNCHDFYDLPAQDR